MKCENCSKEHDGQYGTGRFCCKSCASAFSTKNKRKEINEKVSNKLRKIRYCKICGIDIGFKHNRVLCGDCREQKKHLNTNRSYISKNIKQKVNFCQSCQENINIGYKYCNECSNFWKYQKLFKKLNINDTNLKIANNKSLKLLKEEYFDNELSLLEIREKYGIQLNTVHFYFKKNGISLRKLGESISLSYKNGKSSPNPHGPYKEGYHTTWDNKKVYLRSSYEFNYAKQLDDYKIRYEVENIRIRYYDSIEQKERTSIPDFYLPELNMLVEIKSNYTINIQNMKDKFKEYKKLGYKTKLILEGKDVII